MWKYIAMYDLKTAEVKWNKNLCGLTSIGKHSKLDQDLPAIWSIPMLTSARGISLFHFDHMDLFAAF